MFIRIVTLLALGYLLGTGSLWATHIIGVSLAYKPSPTQNCVYDIEQHVFFDCGGPGTQISLPISANPNDPPFVFAPEIEAITGSCTPNWGPQTILSYADVTPICPLTPGAPGLTLCDTPTVGTLNGVAEAVYRYTVDFCGLTCTEYALTYEQCCRSGSIDNLTFPAFSATSVGPFTIDLNLPGGNQTPIFFSPIMGTVMPKMYICAGQQAVLDFSGTDPDGDSLAYSLTACMEDVAIEVSYDSAAGYSPQAPLGPDWQASLNATTGLLTLSPNPIGPSLVAVVCVRVDEYRNGVLINSNWRDIQLEASGCGGAPPFPTALAVNGGGIGNGVDTILTAPGNTLDLYSLWADNDPNDTLSLLDDVAQQLSGATVSTGGDGDSVAIQWNVPLSSGGQTYALNLQVFDNSCPIPQTGLQAIIVEVSELGLSANLNSGDCNVATPNGSIDLTVSGGVPPYSFLWSTGDTTEDLTGLAGGSYSITVVDSLGLSVTDSFFLNQGDISLNASVVQPDCNAQNGGIGLSPSLGTPPYSYSWSTGDSVSSLAGLGVGGYSVVVTDSNGCFTQGVFELSYDDSCRATLSGVAFFDANGNCVQDAGEWGLSGLYVDLFPGGAMLTDSTGAYAFEVAAGSYDVTINLPSQYVDSCLSSSGYSVTVGTSLADQDSLDFAVAIDPIQDLSVSHQVVTAVVPGDTVWFDLHGQNLGYQSQSAVLSWAFDPAQFEVISTQPVGATVAADSVVFPPVTLLPGFAATARVQVAVDTTLMIGDTAHTFAQIAPLAGDPTPADNRDSLRSPVRTSFDPNDKQVNPAGIGADGLILASDTQRTYTVRFQNTGTNPAQVVVIRDTIDPDLDITSLRMLGSSHDYVARIEADSILVLTFANIHLPDSASDPTGSIGYVRFRLTHQPGLPLGTRLTNRAAIYFDYNAPILTNRTQNRLFAYPALALSGPDTLCEGGEIMARLSQSTIPPYRYRWAADSQTTSSDTLLISPAGLVDGWWTVTVTDGFGSQVRDSLWLAFQALPAADFAYNLTPQGDSTQLSLINQATAADQYTWIISGPTGTVQSNDPAPVLMLGQSGTYEVTQRVQNACGSDTLRQSVVVTLTQVATLPFGAVRVMPNPFQDQAFIRLGQPMDLRFTLRNAQGQTLRQRDLRQVEDISVMRGELLPGVYFFTLAVDGQRYVGKLMLR
jgi:hypothetical protein